MVYICIVHILWSLMVYIKLQALVYDNLPSTAAIGLENLSDNEQFFDDVETAVSL